MKPALWFSRHQPTAEQLADAERRGFQITGIEAGIIEGSRSLETTADVWSVDGALRAAMKALNTGTVFGVFPAPLRSFWLASHSPVVGFESWNVQRTAEGGKPTFSHKSWERTV